MVFLNNCQKYAISFIKGPCLVIAGAGSGKTRVIIEKIIYLIKYGKFRSNDLIALTFTNKAAKEMKDRINRRVRDIDIKDLKILTFHAFGMYIIQSELSILKIDKNFSIINEQEQSNLLHKVTYNLLHSDKVLMKLLQYKIFEWKNNLFDPKKAMFHSISNREKKFAECYNLYENYLKESNLLDFNDLLYVPTRLLQNNNKVRNSWKKKIQYFLVDEYQDTNLIQYKLIFLLQNNNFTLVGDDDQSIYSWRGANLKRFSCLKADFPSIKVIKLEENYRSVKRIIKIANSLISNNIHMYDKYVYSNLDYGTKTKIIKLKNEEDEAEAVLGEVCKISSKSPFFNYKDCAILYRNNYQSQILEKACIKKNIPYSIFGRKSFFSYLEVKIIILYLRLIININDNSAFLQIINIPNRNIGLKTIKRIEEYAYKMKTNLFSACLDKRLTMNISTKNLNSLNNFINLIQKSNKFMEEYSLKMFSMFLLEIKYKKWIISKFKSSKKIKKAIDNVNKFVTWINNILSRREKSNTRMIKDILLKIAILSTNKNFYRKNNKFGNIQLMTLHSSKGLEFLHVFIVGIEEDILPNIQSIYKYNVEEERRLFYVGLTRAKLTLVLTFCDFRKRYGRIVSNKPSRFLYELPKEDVIWENRC